MTSTSAALREIFNAGRPLVEQALDIAEQIAALRDVATAKGLDWSQVKALLKAQIQDERDDNGEGKRVHRLVEKAEFAFAYAGILGLANMNEYKNTAEVRFDAEAGEIEPEEITFTEPSAVHARTLLPEADETGRGANAPVLFINSEITRSAFSAGSGGNPSIPSPADAGAKMEGAVGVIPDRADATSVDPNCDAGRAATNPDDDIPDFLKRNEVAA